MEKISWTDHVRNKCYLESMVKVKQSRYRPGVAQRVPGN